MLERRGRKRKGTKAGLCRRKRRKGRKEKEKEEKKREGKRKEKKKGRKKKGKGGRRCRPGANLIVVHDLLRSHPVEFLIRTWRSSDGRSSSGLEKGRRREIEGAAGI